MAFLTYDEVKARLQKYIHKAGSYVFRYVHLLDVPCVASSKQTWNIAQPPLSQHLNQILWHANKNARIHWCATSRLHSYVLCDCALLNCQFRMLYDYIEHVHDFVRLYLINLHHFPLLSSTDYRVHAWGNGPLAMWLPKVKSYKLFRRINHCVKLCLMVIGNV